MKKYKKTSKNKINIDKLALSAKEDIVDLELLISKFSGIIKGIANKYIRSYGLPYDLFDDLMQEGRIGVICALRDYTAQCNFVTWAWPHIRSKISKHCAKANIPFTKHAEVDYDDDIHEKFMADYSMLPSELAEQLQVIKLIRAETQSIKLTIPDKHAIVITHLIEDNRLTEPEVGKMIGTSRARVWQFKTKYKNMIVNNIKDKLQLSTQSKTPVA